jgi:hypothetical protein
MRSVVPFDTLAVALALRDEAGLDQKQAEGFARVLSRMLVADLVTKDDLAGEAAAVRSDLVQEAKTTRSELRSSTDALKAELSARIETTVAAAKLDTIKWLFGTIVAQTGLIIAAVKLLH